MNIPAISLTALFVAILVSSFCRINAGFLAIALAFTIGVPLGGMKVQAILAGFPTSLFVTLLGITLLFSQARVNGTLEKLARLSVKLARGNSGMIPIIFFGLALCIATVGPGNIAATALLAPLAMTVASRVGITPFLMAIMVANGANAGAFSPFAPTGIIANTLMARIGIAGYEWRNYCNTLIAHSTVALLGFLALGGLKLFTHRGELQGTFQTINENVEPFTTKQKLTLGVIVALVGSVLVFNVDVTIGAFIGAVVLTLCAAADEESALKLIPWNTILMVCGMSLLIGLMEMTGGMELFTGILARLSTQNTATATMAFVTGMVSVYSSSSGVVLPTFLPTIPALISKLGGGDALAIASSINVGAHLVDVSPLSTLGALCIASVPIEADRAGLFNKMLAWGLSMSVVGALVCFVFFGLL